VTSETYQVTSLGGEHPGEGMILRYIASQLVGRTQRKPVWLQWKGWGGKERKKEREGEGKDGSEGQRPGPTQPMTWEGHQVSCG
jgi:hypothetical protein